LSWFIVNLGGFCQQGLGSIAMDKAGTFWATVVVAVVLASILYALARYGLRRFKFSNKDAKAAGLNRQERRRFMAQTRAKRRGKMRF